MSRGTNRPSKGREVKASKNRPPPPVRNNGPQGRGGKLSVSVLVRGHYNKNSKDGKNFDDIVQDSINRDSDAIRRQLTTYNENCKDQTTKVVDLGFTTNDFSEIHSERGANPTKSRAKRRQQQGQDKAEEERAFSSACDRKKVLPDYFEASLGALEVKAKVTKPRTYVVEEESAGPWAIMGTMIAVVVVALCFIYYLLRLGLKRKRLMNQDDSYVTETNSLGWDSDARSHDSRADKIEEYEREMALAKVKSKRALLVDETFPSITKPKKRGYLARMVRREIGNMTAALTNDRWRFYDDDDDGDDGLKKSTGGLPHDAILGGLEARVESSGGSPSDPNASSLELSDFENLSGSAKLSNLELQDSKEKMRASMRRSSTGTLSRSFSGGDSGWGSLRSGGMSYESGYKLDGSKRSLMSRESGYNLDGSKRSLASRRLSIDGSMRSLPGVTQVSYDSGLVSPSSRASGRRPSGRSSTRRHSRNAVPLITGMDLEDGTIVEEESGEGESSSSSSGSSSDDDSSDSSSDSSSSSSDDDNGEARQQPRKRGPNNKKKKTKSGKKTRKRREVGAGRPSSAASKGSKEERRFGRSLMSAEEMETSFVSPHVQWDIPSGSTSSRTSSSRSSRRATLS